MRVSDRSLDGNIIEGLGMESRGWGAVVGVCRRIVLPCGDVRKQYL